MQKCKAQHNMVATRLGGWVARWLAGWVARWLGGWAARAPPPLPPLTGTRPSEKVAKETHGVGNNEKLIIMSTCLFAVQEWVHFDLID